MKNFLPTAGTGIDDRPETVGKPLFARQARQQPQHVRDQTVVRRCKLVQTLDVQARHNQQMHRRLRVDVLEYDHAIVFVYPLGGNRAGDNLAE